VGLALRLQRGSVVVLTAAGVRTGLAYAAAGGDLGQVPRLVGVALAYTPAVWVLVGLATALFRRRDGG
jgi:ABC-2 type transport system permease protein